jgi:hypothetical protein
MSPLGTVELPREFRVSWISGIFFGLDCRLFLSGYERRAGLIQGKAWSALETYCVFVWLVTSVVVLARALYLFFLIARKGSDPYV